MIDRPSQVEAALNDPPIDFVEFFAAERSRLFATLAMIIGDRLEAEDLTQEAFVRVWERWERVVHHPEPIGYLYRTAFNLLRQRRRKLSRSLKHRSDPEAIDDPYIGIDGIVDVAQALRSLSERQRTALVLTDLLGFDSQEAARLLGVQAGTVRSLASQARSSIRVVLGGPDE